MPDGIDSAASLPLVDFLGQDGESLVVYRARRIYRPALSGVVVGHGVHYGGYEFSLPAADVPDRARSVRLGVLSHDEVGWSLRTWPIELHR